MNDNPPAFPEKNLTVTFSESEVIGSYRDLITAHDPDSPRYGVARYQLVDPLAVFELGEQSEGSLTLQTTSSLDRETTSSYLCKVSALLGF